MTGPSDFAAFRHEARLRSGQPVLIRPIRHDDRRRIVEAFHKLEPETIYTRFFSFKRELTEQDLARIDNADFVHAAVLVATVPDDAGDEIIIGGGAYTVLSRPDGPRTAEVSFTIEEDYQGQGLAGLFMRLLIDVGRQCGIECFEAEVLAENPAMLAVFAKCGLPMQRRTEEGVVHVTLDLRPPAAPADRGA